VTFRDLTILGGAVHSRRLYDTRELEPAAVAIAARMLQGLRQGALEVRHGIKSMPSFSVRLGLPPEYPPSPGDPLFFCVGAPARPPWQYNVLLRAGDDMEAAEWAVVTLIGISLLGNSPPGLYAIEEMVAPIVAERPALLATVIPAEGMTLERIKVAADFATCFGAALLLEKTDAR
jgi:hypothetical protein